MWGFKIKIRSADTAFSNYLRSKAKWKCVNPDCKYPYVSYENNHRGLEASHYFGRRHESVRFDEENVAPVCKSCHLRFHQDKEYHKKFMINRLGQQRFDLLTLRAYLRGNKDDAMTILAIKELMRDLK
jgi:hypothetical protein